MNVAKNVVVLLLLASLSGSLGLKCWDCNNAKTNEECLNNGRLKDCVEKNAICEDQIRHENNGKTVLIEKRCKQAHACSNNYVQNVRKAFPIQCNKNSPTSVCRCCCRTDACNRDLMACWNDIPQFSHGNCDPRPSPPDRGNMQCYGNQEPGAYCEFTCHDGYFLKGAPKVTCLLNGTWDYESPRCEMITCPPKREKPGNGSVHCSDGINLGSRCKYICHMDYQLIGSTYTRCVDVGRGDGTGEWTTPKPYCKPLFCPEQSSILHGSMSCTRGRRVRSTCTFACDTDYLIFPKGVTGTQCTSDGVWSVPLPCCQYPCPPNALMDFAVILDSSSSVGLENWGKMTKFVRSFLDDFTVRSDSTHYSIIRYNRDVDTDTQILFNDYTDDLQGVLTAFDNIPYNGGGTQTGKALNYTADVLLKIGNRPEAKDVVLLITDGASQDPVAIPSKKIRDAGALFFILPVKPPTGRLDMDEIREMAGPGNEDNILKDALVHGFDALDQDFAKRMSVLLCGAPCSLNPIHHHERD